MSCLLVVGLGNPGVKYQNTRHNVGFMVLDFLSKALNFAFHFDKKFNAEVGTLHTDFHKVFFLKPLTFMNLSGDSIAPFVRYFDIAHTLIIHDDIDIIFGDIRFKYGGSSGGHNGLKSIDKAMGDTYLRLRFGVGRNTQGNVIDYVLSNFNTQEIAQITETMPFVQSAIAYFYTMQGSMEDILVHLQNRFTLRNKSQKTNKDSINIAKQNIGDTR